MKIDIIQNNNLIFIKPIKPLSYIKLKNIKSTNIEDFSNLEGLKANIYKMVKSCIVDDGIALAAPQIGILKNIIVVRESDSYYSEYINLSFEPIVSDGKNIKREGCLSVPGKFLPIERWNKIKATWQEFNSSNTQEIIFKTEIIEGFKARVLQHEKDHIVGRSIVEVSEAQKKQKLKGK